MISLAGPAIVILSMVPSLAGPVNQALADFSDSTGMFGIILSFVSFATSVVWLVHRWNKGPRKLLWYLLVVLNSIIVVPVTILVATGQFG